MTSLPTLIDYPCEFPIKIMGKEEQDFTKSILMIVHRHVLNFDDKNIETRLSKKNKYLSLTCTVYVTSQSQLDALYQELCDHPMVLMVL
jgi:putative lipoic acid-binding regulatory protein|tara:strand:+ start:1377 stop:1643 length:267 start_codon:yes stop_codon:yes gene_type:complete